MIEQSEALLASYQEVLEYVFFHIFNGMVQLGCFNNKNRWRKTSAAVLVKYPLFFS